MLSRKITIDTCSIGRKISEKMGLDFLDILDFNVLMVIPVNDRNQIQET